MDGRDEILRKACEDAIVRLAAAHAGGVLLAPLGETLFWLVALAEATGTKRAPEVDGLRWARNQIAHGVVVTAPVRRRGGGSLGDFVLGQSILGGPPEVRWLGRDSIPLAEDERHDHAGESAYDARVAGRYLIDPIREALAAIDSSE